MQIRLNKAVEAARKAGEYLLSRPAFSVTHKLSNDYVTEADQGSEKIIREVLLSAFPRDGFLGEEGGERAGETGRWIVDPIDGTTNFICDLPLYTISIAYEQEGALQLGVVYCPRLGEMFTALRGGGAYLNGQPIHVSQKSVLRDAIVAMSFAHRDEGHGARMMRVLPEMRKALSDMRRLGSAALDLCFVACGRMDAYMELDLNPYDFSAGMLIVEEAGGIVTGWPGDAQGVRETGNVFAANAVLHQPMFEAIEQAENAHPDAILILGHRLEPGCLPSEDLIRRIDRAVEEWHAKGQPMLMPCGGITPPHSRTEAEVMLDMLLERGVPKDKIRLEDKSRITIENIRNAKGLLPEHAHVAMVTSDYHVERALSDCRRAGLSAYGVGAVTPPGEYRDQMFAKDRAIAQRMESDRKRGLTDADIVSNSVARMERDAHK